LEEDDFEDIQALVLNLQSAISLKEASVEEAKAELEKWTNPVFEKNAFRGKMRFGKNFTGPKCKLDRI
jgi:hypothetical protein